MLLLRLPLLVRRQRRLLLPLLSVNELEDGGDGDGGEGHASLLLAVSGASGGAALCLGCANMTLGSLEKGDVLKKIGGGWRGGEGKRRHGAYVWG